MGVGIHAGEAIETSEGYFGAAVNLASRLCAIAQAGEVLVTATVRGITQASVPVAFAPRGRRRLKGIDDPVEVFAVTAGEAARPTRAYPTRLAAGAAVVAVAAVVAIGVILASVMRGGSGANPSSSPGVIPNSSPSPVASPAAVRSLDIGALPLGEYTASEFEPPFGFVITDLGWSAYRHGPDIVGLLRDSEPQGTLDIVRIEVLLTDPCVPDRERVSAGRLPEDLVNALTSLSYVDAGDPGATTVGARAGFTLDLSITEGALAACGGFDVALFPVADEHWRAVPKQPIRLVALDVDGTTVTFLMTQDDSTATIVPAFDAFVEDAQRVVDSVDF